MLLLTGFFDFRNADIREVRDTSSGKVQKTHGEFVEREVVIGRSARMSLAR